MSGDPKKIIDLAKAATAASQVKLAKARTTASAARLAEISALPIKQQVQHTADRLLIPRHRKELEARLAKRMNLTHAPSIPRALSNDLREIASIAVAKWRLMLPLVSVAGISIVFLIIVSRNSYPGAKLGQDILVHTFDSAGISGVLQLREGNQFGVMQVRDTDMIGRIWDQSVRAFKYVIVPRYAIASP
jgi:hypothetical protein